MTDAITIENLTKSFHGRPVLQDLNLSVPRGSIFGFIGPNGAGKTTTIRLLLGLLKPDAGKITILGQDLRTHSIALRRRIGYVSEQASFYPWMQVDELVKFNAGFFPTWERGKTAHLLKIFHLDPTARVKELSRGMLTQLSLIMALSHHPELLILDEPTAGLDPVWRRRFLQLLSEETAGGETTVFLSSQILTDIERIADRLAIIVNGQIRVVRTLDKLKHHEKIIRVVFQQAAPETLLNTPGIRSIERQGHGYLLTVEDHFDEIYEALSRTPHFALEIIEQDLEEIFLNYAASEEDPHNA